MHFVFLLRLRVAIHIDVEWILALGRLGFIVKEPLLVDCFACADGRRNACKSQEIQHVHVLGYLGECMEIKVASSKDILC
jgi:hypothetical protein